jgi:hypothetical protein
MSTRRALGVGRIFSKHAGAMRASLLVSLGLSPLACGGTAISASDAEGSAGSPPSAGGQGGGSYAGGPYGNGSGGLSYAGSSYGSQGGVGPYTAGTGGGPVVQGGTGGYSAPQCDSPTFDRVTHLTRCASGLEHRPTAVACPYFEGGWAGETGEAGAGDIGTACQSDSDCATGQLCECQGGGTPGSCVTAACRVDADCGANSLCAAALEPGSYDAFLCTSSRDECSTDADCTAPGQQFAYCSSVGLDHRVCSSAVCGRPFLVDASPRLAEVETRSDWLNAQIKPNISGLSPLQRAELAAHWARLGQMEHASIAAFARFNLQLLSLGAPGELVEACNRALVDETAHTQLCFALASEYGGAALGPARLDIAHWFEETSLEEIMKLVLREGCLGETVAALEAATAATLATDPAVKRALSRIAQDEQAHAGLAFKFLAWALTQSSPETRAQLEREAQLALDDFEAAALARPAEQRQESLASDGVIGTEALRALHLGAVREVVEPLISAILRQSANANHSALTPA